MYNYWCLLCGHLFFDAERIPVACPRCGGMVRPVAERDLHFHEQRPWDVPVLFGEFDGTL